MLVCSSAHPGGAKTAILLFLFSIQKEGIATGIASSRLPESQKLAISFKSLRWFLSLVNAVVFPIMYKLLVVSQPVRALHAGRHVQSSAPSFFAISQTGTNLCFVPCPEYMYTVDPNTALLE